MTVSYNDAIITAYLDRRNVAQWRDYMLTCLFQKTVIRDSAADEFVEAEVGRHRAVEIFEEQRRQHGTVIDTV